MKGRDSFDDEVEDWTGREVEATVEAIDFLTVSTAAALANEAFELRFLASALRLTSRLVCAEVEQLWS